MMKTDWPPKDLKEVISRQKGQGKSKSPEEEACQLAVLEESWSRDWGGRSETQMEQEGGRHSGSS